MSRDTIFSTEPAKYFQGDDLKQKHKKATHLITYSNFLVADIDHSLDRPFAVSSRNCKKMIKTPDFHLNRENLPNFTERKINGKKMVLDYSSSPFKTSHDPLIYSSSQIAIPLTFSKKRVALKSRSQSEMELNFKPCKRVNHEKIHDSSGVKDSLKYN